MSISLAATFFLIAGLGAAFFMRRLPARGSVALALGAALAILPCCGQRPATDVEPSAREQVTPSERGRLRARADIAAGKLRIYRYGNPASFSNPRTESGLPVRTLLDCCITTEARKETEAYNRVMRETAAARRAVIL